MKKALNQQGFLEFGSSTWARTRDTWINSPLLYQLSYRGIGEGVILKASELQVNTKAQNFMTYFY